MGCDAVALGVSSKRFEGPDCELLDNEHKDTVTLRNVGNYIPNDTASHPTRLEYSAT